MPSGGIICFCGLRFVGCGACGIGDFEQKGDCMENRDRRFRLQTVAGKNAVMMALFGCVMLAFAAFLPQLFYRLTQEELTNQIAVSIRESSVRIGFLLTGHRNAGTLRKNEEFLDLLQEYYEPGADQGKISGQISKYLSPFTESKGQDQQGGIGSTNQYLTLTERGDAFCREEALPLLEALCGTPWYQDLFTADQEFSYSPVLTLSDGEGERDYLAFAWRFPAGEIQCRTIHVMEFDDYTAQLRILSKTNITDYALADGDQILYRSREDGITPGQIDPSGYSESQFSVVKQAVPGGYVFNALCSLRREAIYVIVHMSRDEILMPFLPFFRILQRLMALLSFLMVLLSCVLVWFSLRRLNRLSREMVKIQNGGSSIDMEDGAMDEIGQIVRASKGMLSQIQEDIRQRLQMEETEKRMQYLLMVSAIDPHFIYNTLDTVSFLAAMGRNEDVVTVNDALIVTLKDRLRSKTYRTWDTVAAERQVIESYLVIQRYLCSGKIDCEFLVSGEDLNLYIPKNILQPLVENSIKHGILKNMDETGLHVRDGRIRIRIWREGERIWLEVWDNGCGIPPEVLQEYSREIPLFEEEADHIGLRNVRGRLSWLSRGDYTFAIESGKQEGTAVRISFARSAGVR